MKKRLAIIFILLCISFTALGGVHNSSADTAQAKGRSVNLLVVMYHNILNCKNSIYIVSSRQLEEDLKALKQEGYTSVFPSEVIAFVKGKGTLPKKPIMITFDDGYYNNMYYALPILKKYNMKANLNVIGAFSEHSTNSGDHSDPSYSHITWTQLKELADSGYFEIGNHTYNMHKFKPRYGIMPKKAESELVYKQKLKKDVAHLQEILKENCGLTPNVFAYPFGRYSQMSKEVLLSMGFEMLLTCNEGINTITVGDLKCLHYMKRFNRNSRYTTDRLMCIIANSSKKQK
jgi:peptidoglycan/xylan/chitin deacetylase (PgdA/CDA1 family)